MTRKTAAQLKNSFIVPSAPYFPVKRKPNIPSGVPAAFEGS